MRHIIVSLVFKSSLPRLQSMRKYLYGYYNV